MLLMSPPRAGTIAAVIEAEFREMPGMRLTEAQACRLWNLSKEDCDDVLGYLVDRGLLVRDATGRYTGRSLNHY